MQPVHAHNPPEDVEDDDEINREMAASKDNFGIGTSYGMKIGMDG